MPYGKGTYGSKVGRPSKKQKDKIKAGEIKKYEEFMEIKKLHEEMLDKKGTKKGGKFKGSMLGPYDARKRSKKTY
tara:strand:+ start:1131 stop:1355 length:225 start_codon:yes stop_codon:yes gene_type:complete